MTWSHPCCYLCWYKRNPHGRPEQERERRAETCVYCGELTFSGIYVRGAAADEEEASE